MSIFVFLFYICSFLIAIVNPFWGFVALTSSILIRFQDRFPEVAAFKPFLLLLTAMLLGCMLNAKKLNKISVKQDRLLVQFAGFSLFCLVLLDFGEVTSQASILLASLSFYYFATRIIQNGTQLKILLFVLAGIITFLGYEAMVDVGLNGDKSIHIDPRNGRWQGLGYYANANEFGQLMIAMAPLLLVTLLQRKSILLMIASVGMGTIMLIVLSKTLSRTCMLSLSMMAVMVFVLKGEGKAAKKLIFAAVLMFVVFMLLLTIPSPVQDRLESVLNFNSDSSFQGRTRSWEYGFQMLTWYPLTGVGIGQWIEYHGLMPHNSFVQVLSETGPIGFWLYMSVIVLTYRQLLKRIFIEDKELLKQKDVAEHRMLSITVVTILTGYMLYIFVGNQAYAPWTFFYLGICTAVANMNPIKDKNVRKEKLVD